MHGLARWEAAEMFRRLVVAMAACAVAVTGCREPEGSKADPADQTSPPAAAAGGSSRSPSEQWWCPGDGGYDGATLVSARLTNVDDLRDWQSDVGGPQQDFLSEHSGDEHAAVCVYEAESFPCPGGPPPQDGASRPPYTHASTIVVGESTYVYQCIRGTPDAHAYGPATSTRLHEPATWPPGP
jgi:hypothetical protein